MFETPNSIPSVKLSTEVLHEWQDSVDALAKTLKVPSVSITRHTPPFFEIVCASQADKNPFSSGSYQPCEDSYCEEVIRSGKTLNIPDATKSNRWENSPSLKNGLLSYLGLPVFMPDGKAFGTFFIAHTKTNSFPDESEKLLQQFKGTIESHLASLLQTPQINTADDETKSANRTLLTLISNLPGIVYRCANDPDWTVEYIHGDCLNLTGYSNEDIEHNRKISLAGLIHPADKNRVWDKIKKDLKNKEPFELTYRIISAGGQEKWVWEQGCGIFSEKGELQALEGFITEITEQKNAEIELEKHKNRIEELERSNRQFIVSAEALKRSNRELEQFAFLACHDLQEPLRKIKTLGSFIQDRSENLDEEGSDYLTRLIKSTGRMQNFITDLLKFARVTGQTRQHQKINLNDIFQDVLLDLEDRITSTHAEIQIDKLPLLSANAVQMRQLFQNLLSNSLKFHKKDVAPVIKVRTQLASNGNMKIVIEDNGIGLRPEHTERIFKPFERLHGRDEYEGSGIGLSLCQKIVSQHGWEIKAEGSPGQGTSIIIALPSQQT